MYLKMARVFRSWEKFTRVPELSNPRSVEAIESPSLEAASMDPVCPATDAVVSAAPIWSRLKAENPAMEEVTFCILLMMISPAPFWIIYLRG